jgi:hypothetical protein
MATVPTRPASPQALASSAPAPSTAGGLLVLAQAWGQLGGPTTLAAGIHWQGRGAGVLLFAFVVIPLLAAHSVRAVAGRCGSADPLWRVMDWAGLVSQRRLARFASSPRHQWRRVLAAMVGALAQHPVTRLGDDIVLAVDTTTVEKRWGRHLPRRQPVYSGVRKRLVDGYELVSAWVSDPHQGWPVGLVAHAPVSGSDRRRRRAAQPGEAPSKLDEALALVETVIATVAQHGTVVGDSAFAVQWWLRALRERGWDFLVGTRADRRLRIGAEIRSFTQWVPTLPLEPLGPHLWGGRLSGVTLLDRHCDQRGLPVQAVYVERRDHQGRVVHRWHLVTSQTTWDLATIWAHWKRRWPVEMVHRDGKQHLQLNDFHARTWAGIQAWVAATSLRASLVAFIRAAGLLGDPESTEATVATLRLTPSLILPTDTGRVQATLPTGYGMPTAHPHPLPGSWWPVTVCAA